MPIPRSYAISIREEATFQRQKLNNDSVYKESKVERGGH
jgi:hypothetical protein